MQRLIPAASLLAVLGLLVVLPTTLPADQPLVAVTTDGYVLQGPSSPAGSGLPHPEEFLGYALGTRYTYHHRIVAYLEALAEASDRVQIEEYGRTVEDRPLDLVTISSPGNLKRLDEILENNRRPGTQVAGASENQVSENQPAIVWLGYGVHGNETSSAEAAMAVAWSLAAGPAPDLEDVVVILDPLVNPDGRERYVRWFREVSGLEPDADPDALEHDEPWPGGRFNHYLFDLNRDWTWLTQPESRQRIAAYRRVLPQVYVDVHEMSANSTYYFPPPARPVLPLLAGAPLEDLEIFGQANAHAFDARGWTYFAREVYDFFYPGYGDTYPTLRGSLGMTFEMAGGGRSGKLVRRRDGTRLSLADRVARHTVSTLETVRTAARNRQHLLRRFAERRSAAAKGPARTYLWRADQPEARDLAELLMLHGLEVKRLEAPVEIKVQPVWPGDEVRRQFEAGTFLAATDQPEAPLLRALLERRHDLAPDFLERQSRRLAAGEDEELYDVTAWSLPLAYGVETWVVGEVLSGHDLSERELSVHKLDRDAERDTPADAGVDASSVGWRIPPQGLAGHRLTAALLREGVALRLAMAPTEGDLYGVTYRSDGKGTVFVPREGNDAGVAEALGRLAAEAGVRVDAVTSGLRSGERNPGSGFYRRVIPPRVGLVAGDGISPTSHGALWNLFDRQVRMAVRRIDLAQLSDGSLAELDVLVLPDGRWNSVAESTRESLARWLRQGGVLVAIGDAYELAKTAEWTEIETRQTDGVATSDDAPASHSAGRSQGRAAEPSVPGAFLAGEFQSRHPLALGTAAPIAVLTRGSRFLEPSGDPRIDLLTVRAESPLVSGLLWPAAETAVAGSLLVSTERVGDGTLVIFAQDPAFRGFVRASMNLLLDIVFYAPSL